ncbi:MAG: hypothetical protein PHI98_12275 [Eubacteriales bacterium]|nr:hypothetical protein [Eubacteriales bacterium]
MAKRVSPPPFDFSLAAADWQDWQTRRPELLGRFVSEVYGCIPAQLSMDTLAVEELVTADRQRVRVYRLGTADFSCSLRLYLPSGDDCQAILLYLLLADQEDSFVPISDALAKSCAVALLRCDELAKDQPNARETGIFTWMKQNKVDAGGTGALAAWAWGLSQAQRCLQRDPALAHLPTTVVGYSRGGKSALWACALYGGFAGCAAVHSGCGGASLFRAIPAGKERIAEITKSFPYWFSTAFSAYGGREEQLTVDQHMLLALCAPSSLLIINTLEDPWCDAASEERSCALAKPVYDLPGCQGSLSYIAHSGDHTFTHAEWEWILQMIRRKNGSIRS